MMFLRTALDNAATTAPQQDLPEWDLGDLYTCPTDPRIAHDLEKNRTQAKNFQARYQGHLASLDAVGLAKAIGEYEALNEQSGRIGSYAGLLRAKNLDDPLIGQFYQNTYESLNDVRTDLLFFTLELNHLDQALLDRLLQDPALAHYRPFIVDTRAFKPHQLDEKLEKLSHDKKITSAAAWIRLYDETLARLRFDVNGESLTLNDVVTRQMDKDPKRRQDAALSMAKTLAEQGPLFALITNTLAKEGAIEDTWRGFPRPVSARNLENRVEDAVVDALVSAVRDSYATLSHRYYRLKAKWFGRDALPWWDRNAPLPWADDRTITWDEACAIIAQAYGAFSPTLADLAKNFLTKPWLDAAPKPGKDSGAFSHPTVPSAHPYILMNYRGRMRDVMTLAHELGHGVHQILCAPQGYLMGDAPLTLAETASVFGEMLTFEYALSLETDRRRRLTLIAGKVEDMLNTVVRQISFHEFETQIHTTRRERELLPEEINDIWLATQRASLGPGLTVGDEYGSYWAYISHFIHAPFYVYAYAFGDCLVNALFATYRSQPAGFVDKYLDLLRAGGTKRHRELLAPFGLDAADPAFWKSGLSLIGRFIDELESLTSDEKAA